MNSEAWNKITQTHDLFKKIIAPLKQHLDINFGYMIVFKDGSYYQIIENLECLKKWVTNVETSNIFCARNVTTYFDEPYNFTIWPEEPTCTAMEIYKEYGMWNGITVSKVQKDYTELYWFTKQNAEVGWHKWFIRNKALLLEFIESFMSHNNKLRIVQNITPKGMFKFNYAFETSIQNSKYKDLELTNINKARTVFQLNFAVVEVFNKEIKLSLREVEVLSMVAKGYPYKIVAVKLGLTQRTIKFHIERIRSKTGVRFKSDLLQLYNNISMLNSYTY